MQSRLLELLRCPECGETLEPIVLNEAPNRSEISEGVLRCAREHWFPIVRGIPRMLPNALNEHWSDIAPQIPDPPPQLFRNLVALRDVGNRWPKNDRTAQNFSLEWDNHKLGGQTWGMLLKDRVDAYFTLPLKIPEGELSGKVLLDAGCGNGSQSVAYTEMGLEVVAIDLSSGPELGYAYRMLHAGARPEKVHFVQADLQQPPLAPASVDIIHSAGVLHHTPDTKKTFRALVPLLRPGGTFYVWLYKHEPYVTPLVNSIRTVTTRIPPVVFARIAELLAVPFIIFCATVNALRIREYKRLSRHEAALALMDIFGAPYAHYHSFDEVAGWYNEVGFEEVWPCNDGRRGFGVCGRLSKSEGAQSSEAAEQQSQLQPQTRAVRAGTGE